MQQNDNETTVRGPFGANFGVNIGNLLTAPPNRFDLALLPIIVFMALLPIILVKLCYFEGVRTISGIVNSTTAYFFCFWMWSYLAGSAVGGAIMHEWHCLKDHIKDGKVSVVLDIIGQSIGPQETNIKKVRFD